METTDPRIAYIHNQRLCSGHSYYEDVAPCYDCEGDTGIVDDPRVAYIHDDRHVPCDADGYVIDDLLEDDAWLDDNAGDGTWRRTNPVTRGETDG